MGSEMCIRDSDIYGFMYSVDHTRLFCRLFPRDGVKALEVVCRGWMGDRTMESFELSCTVLPGTLVSPGSYDSTPAVHRTTAVVDSLHTHTHSVGGFSSKSNSSSID